MYIKKRENERRKLQTVCFLSAAAAAAQGLRESGREGREKRGEAGRQAGRQRWSGRQGRRE